MLIIVIGINEIYVVIMEQLIWHMSFINASLQQCRAIYDTQMYVNLDIYISIIQGLIYLKN